MAEHSRRRASARKRKRGELSLGPGQDVDHANFVQQEHLHLHELRNFTLNFSEIQFRLVLPIKLEKVMEGRGADSRAVDRHIRRGDASAQAKLPRAFLLIEATLAKIKQRHPWGPRFWWGDRSRCRTRKPW